VRRLNWHGLSPKARFAVRVLGCFVFCTLAMIMAGPEEANDSIWAANGLLLSYLLLSPRNHWLPFVAAGFVAQVFGRFLVGDESWTVYVAMAVLNIAEILLAGCLMRGRGRDLPRFTNRAYLIRFVGLAVVAAPAAVGIVFAFLAALWIKQPIWQGFRDWFVSDALGYAITTPAIVAIFRTRFRGSSSDPKLLYLLAVVPITILSFRQVVLSPFSIMAPMLVIILLRFGMGWASTALLYVAIFANSYFSHLHPKLAFAGDGRPILALQVFLLSTLITLYSVSVVIEHRRVAEKKLREMADVYRLVTDNSRDVIIIADFKGNRSYVSAAANGLGGWRLEELLKLKSLDLIHPEDRASAEAAVRAMAKGGDGSVIECRVRRKDGEYLWTEASLRTIRNPLTGAPVGILNMVRDISRRKLAEEKLQAAYRAMENMAVMDALTGLANRRRFDEYMATEWKRALRENKPLSVVLMDVDWFKHYNDTYGHLRGDRCLKTIADALRQVVERPGDLVARFGGEEFAVILPDTAAEGARTVADALFEAVRSRRLAHRESALGFVTISAGVATCIPQEGDPPFSLVDEADRALYSAKRLGRSRVCVAPAVMKAAS
jgi:diguanylate cyclase (GGDEF)-like protein/PAS domain S-box-containing protein